MADVSIQFQTNNITYRDGDSLIISFDGPFNAVDKFNSYTETTSPDQTTNDYFITNVRWSKDFQTWSPWILMTKNPDGTKNFPNIEFDSGSSIYLEFKYIRVSQPEPPTPNSLSLTQIDLNFDTNVPESDYTNPPAKICPSGDYYKGIRIDCEDGNLFRIYDLMGPAIQLNRELALSVSEMFGWNVCYFKVAADGRTKDVILKEYSLYNVSDIKNIRVVVPDNQFPDNKIMFTPFDMNFEEGFEVHIVKEDFERAFGYCVRPEERDYLYFPLENRIYKVESPYLYKDFMRDGVYYKLNLVKWQDSQNIINTGATAANDAAVYIEDVTQSFDIFNEEKEKEFTQITKPLQYNTINLGAYDFVRSEMNEKLAIDKHDINNYFTIVAKYAYDLNTIDYNDLAIRYKTEVDVKETDDRVYMFWFKANRDRFVNPEIGPEIINEYPVGDPSEGLKYDVIFDGTGGGTSGIQIRLQYGDTNGDNAYVTKGFEVIVNGQSYLYDTNYLDPWPNNTFPNLLVDAKQYNQQTLTDSRKWFAIVLNVSNEYQTMNLNVWEMMFDASKPAYVQQTTQLKLVFGETKDFAKQEIKPGAYYELKGWPGLTTNIRLLTELINEENQPLMLNRYTVRDNQYAKMIDNALPPLKMTREPVR
jgi:hypothetical protein